MLRGKLPARSSNVLTFEWSTFSRAAISSSESPDLSAKFTASAASSSKSSRKSLSTLMPDGFAFARFNSSCRLFASAFRCSRALRYACPFRDMWRTPVKRIIMKTG